MSEVVSRKRRFFSSVNLKRKKIWRRRRQERLLDNTSRFLQYNLHAHLTAQPYAFWQQPAQPLAPSPSQPLAPSPSQPLAAQPLAAQPLAQPLAAAQPLPSQRR
jgi:hypothetical protein